MASQENQSLVVEVLRTGPADGQHILEHIHDNNSLWEDVYLASRSSPYAIAWREAFGRQRLGQIGIQSVLELAVSEIRHRADQSLDDSENARNAVFIAKLIANCCADNNHNRRVAIKAGVLLPLMSLLLRGADPNILVPTIYNVCADLEDPAEHLEISPSDDEGVVQPTLSEERLATTDGSAKSMFSGIFLLLSPPIILGCSDEIKEYLAEVIEMAARPSAVVEPASRVALSNALDRLLATDGGRVLAEHSAKCRSSIIRALLAIVTPQATKTYLASSGVIFDVAFIANSHTSDQDYYGDDEDEQKENFEVLEGLKTIVLKLVYEVCQLPQFSAPPKYGIARQALDIVGSTSNTDSFSQTVAYIILYGFIDSNARAHLLASENLIPSVVRTLQSETDKAVIHPALGLATKLAVTWSLRAELHKASVMQAIQHLLSAANMGYEIPLNAVTFLEILTKGHPEHVKTMLINFDSNRTIMEDLFVLFDKGHDAICLEIGRLLIEICATLAQQTPSEITAINLELNTFLAACNQQALSRILIFMGTKAQTADAGIAQRVWFALGLLSTTEQGRQIVLLACQNPDLQTKIRALNSEVESWSGGNVKYMLYNLGISIDQIGPGATDDLDSVMGQLRLG